ncbi:MAG: hypothetical protein SNG10_04955, partial [Rikenellaceae bacterium]
MNPFEITTLTKDNPFLYMQDLAALEGKSLAELKTIGKSLGIKNVNIRKGELLSQIQAVASAPQQGRSADAPQKPRRGRKPKSEKNESVPELAFESK